MKTDFAVIGGVDISPLVNQNSINIKIRAVYKAHGKQVDKTFSAKDVGLGTGHIIYVNRHSVGLVEGKSNYMANEIDYKTIIVGLYQYGIQRLIDISAAGSAETSWPPGSMVLIKDCADFINRDTTLDDMGSDVVDMGHIFDEPMASEFLDAAKETGITVHNNAIYIVSVNGSRFQTPTEIKILKGMLGSGIVVGMSLSTEAHLAKMLGIKCIGLSLITNYAPGMQQNLKLSAISGAAIALMPKVLSIISCFLKK